MEPFRIHTGLVAPLARANVDTDAIIPKQFLKSIKRSGFGPNLFDAWRYLDRGEPGVDNSRRPRNPDFLLKPGELLQIAHGRLEVLAYENLKLDAPRPAVVQRICAVNGASAH